MSKNQSRSGIFLSFVLACFSVSACGQQGQLYGVVGQNINTSAISVDEDESTCMGGDYNVLPEYIYTYPGDFHACTDDSDSYTVVIDGSLKLKTGSHYSGSVVPEEICVFPSQVYNYGNGQGKVAVWKPDTSGFPMYKCVPIGASESSGRFSEVEARFDLTNFDSVFIVDVEDVMSMRTCLLTGNDSSCPDYAFGQFRTLDSSGIVSSQTP